MQVTGLLTVAQILKKIFLRVFFGFCMLFKIYLLLILSILLISCTRIDNEFIYPDSTPLSLVPVPLFHFNIKSEKVQIESIPYRDSISIFMLNAFNLYDEKFKSVTLFSIGDPQYFIEQVNFLRKKYGTAQNIYLVPFIDDFNKNGSIDQVFLIDYEDSAVVQIRDQLHQMYPSSPSTDINDEYINYTIYKGNGFKINFFFTWIISDTNAYLVFNKNNRITASKTKEPDTLFFFNPYTLHLKKLSLPIGVFLTIPHEQTFRVSILKDFFEVMKSFYFRTLLKMDITMVKFLMITILI